MRAIAELTGLWTILLITVAQAVDGTVIDVPEPASLSLLAVAAGAIVVLRRRR